MATIPRYRLDFAVPDRHDIAEPDDTARNPKLDHIRAVLADDGRWERSMMAPFRPYGQQQRLIVWVDTHDPNRTAIGKAVFEIVDRVLPGVTLTDVVLLTR